MELPGQCEIHGSTGDGQRSEQAGRRAVQRSYTSLSHDVALPQRQFRLPTSFTGGPPEAFDGRTGPLQNTFFYSLTGLIYQSGHGLLSARTLLRTDAGTKRLQGPPLGSGWARWAVRTCWLEPPGDQVLWLRAGERMVCWSVRLSGLGLGGEETGQACRHGRSWSQDGTSMWNWIGWREGPSAPAWDRASSHCGCR